MGVCVAPRIKAVCLTFVIFDCMLLMRFDGSCSASATTTCFAVLLRSCILRYIFSPLAGTVPHACILTCYKCMCHDAFMHCHGRFLWMGRWYMAQPRSAGLTSVGRLCQCAFQRAWRCQQEASTLMAYWWSNHCEASKIQLLLALLALPNKRRQAVRHSVHMCVCSGSLNIVVIGFWSLCLCVLLESPWKMQVSFSCYRVDSVPDLYHQFVLFKPCSLLRGLPTKSHLKSTTKLQQHVRLLPATHAMCRMSQLTSCRR
jgi:hypothetical protein